MKRSTAVVSVAFLMFWLAAMSVNAFGAPITFTAVLNGASESPANASPAAGFASIVFDTVAHTLSVTMTYSGLSGFAIASHIHCCTTVPGNGTVALATQTPTFVGFPAQASGTYVHVFDAGSASTFFAPFITANGGTPAGAEAALIAGAASGKAYLDLHTLNFTGGEIRGFLVAVPETSSMVFLVVAIAGILAYIHAMPGRLRER